MPQRITKATACCYASNAPRDTTAAECLMQLFFDMLQIKIRQELQNSLVHYKHSSDRVILPVTVVRTLSVMLSAFAVTLGQAMLREGGEDPRVLQKLDTVLAKLDEILKLMQTGLKHQEEIRLQDQIRRE